MTVREAEKIRRDYYGKISPSEEDRFLYAEALGFLIGETRDASAMVELGAMHYEQRQFDLALKYYEMAAERGNLNAISNLGYIWYYGRTGEVDYEKAFSYFDRARQMGDLIAAYKVADMYKNGYFVAKDPARYRKIIEELYLRVKDHAHPDTPAPEIFTRLAGIRAEEGKTEEALSLYDHARKCLEWRIQVHPFFGDLTIMKWLIRDVYRLRDFDESRCMLFDLYYLLEKPVRVRFFFEGKPHEVEAVPEAGGMTVRFDDRWFRTVDDFFRKAELDGLLLTTRCEELFDFEVL